MGDFNNDGKLDLLVGNLGSNSSGNVSILLGNGDGTLKNETGFGGAVGRGVDVNPQDTNAGLGAWSDGVQQLHPEELRAISRIGGRGIEGVGLLTPRLGFDRDGSGKASPVAKSCAPGGSSGHR